MALTVVSVTRAGANRDAHSLSAIKGGKRFRMAQIRLLALTQVKNQAWVIERFLQRTAEFTDAIVVLDDGSTDGTYEILKTHPKVVRLFRNSPGTPWHEVKCHNTLLAAARELDPEWIIIIDVDEILDARFTSVRDELLSRNDVGRYHFQEITLWRSSCEYRIDKPDWYMRPRGCSPWLLRFTPRLRWTHQGFQSWKSFAYEVLKRHRIPRRYNVGIRVLLGQLPGEVELPYVKLHYHFADRELAWRTHMRNGIMEAIQFKKQWKDLDAILEFATRRLDETGLQLAPVKLEWGAL